MFPQKSSASLRCAFLAIKTWYVTNQILGSLAEAIRLELEELAGRDEWL